MASGSPCVNSRWDRAKADVLPNDPRASGGSADASDPPQGGVEMAAAMAAKINAMLMAKGKLKPLQPLPSKAPPISALPVVADELVVAEVDINDVPIDCRNLLTKGKTQEEIAQFSGAAVSTKGLYMSDADRCSSAGVARPLYLQVQGRSQDDVNKAVARIKQIISEDVLRSSGGQTPAVMPTVPVYRQPITAAAPPPPAARAAGAPVIPGHKPAPPHSGRQRIGLHRAGVPPRVLRAAVPVHQPPERCGTGGGQEAVRESPGHGAGGSRAVHVGVSLHRFCSSLPDTRILCQ